MKEKTLVILAAGMGSRFGGMKQIEPVGPNGEFIIDYSIYSAIKYGFNKIVFIIKEENYEVFRKTIGKRIENKVKVEYAFQKLEDIPSGFEIPEGRVKPWGTAHAIYAARKYLNDNFGVITSDDFYGDDAFRVLSEHLSNSNNYVIVGYEVGDTLSDNGAVKRARIFHDGLKVSSLVESSCTLENDKVRFVPLDPSKKEMIGEKTDLVSMLLNGFSIDILNTIGNVMENEFTNNKDNLNDYEMLLPDIIDLEIKNGKNVDVVKTTSKWMGMTYKEDKELLKNFINSEIEKGVYPKKLWD